MRRQTIGKTKDCREMGLESLLTLTLAHVKLAVSEILAPVK